MESQLEQIREQQKDSWNKFSQGWKKWDDLTMDFLKPMGEEIIRQLKPKSDDMVLDVAAGTGESAIAIAALIGKGKVTVTDLAEGMLEIAREKAARKGITNIETMACDVCELPFADNTFDAISCRLGFMFFPDMQLAAKEMMRVLKPGGRIATSVWNGPEKNFWVTVSMGAIAKNMQLTPPTPGAPGMFRCAQKGLVADLFKQAGLKNISEIEVAGKLNTGTSENYWNMMNEVAAPIVSALSNADDTMKTKIRGDVFESLKQKFTDGKVVFDSSATVIYGEK